MNNLIPQLRPDRNGKLVTRHVRADAHTASATSLAAPTLGAQDEPQEEVVSVPKTRTITIRPDRLQRATKRLESANKRLERAGMDPFEWHVEQREEERIGRDTFGGISEYHNVVDLVVNYPEVKTATHEFIGSLTQEESGMITRLKEDEDLGDWRPRESYCDHCGTARRRNFTVVVRDRESGELSQVGSSCVEGYLGVDPAHLFSLNFNPLTPEDEEEEEKYRSGHLPYISAGHKVDVRKALAAALVASNDGTNYTKRKDWWQGLPGSRSAMDASTYADVLATLRDVSEDHVDHPWTKDMQKKTEDRLADGSVDEFIKELIEDPDTSEYMENLRVLMMGEKCELRNLGMVVSAVTVYRRKHAPKIEETQVNEWLGKEKEKLTDIPAKIERVRYKENQYGMTTIITMRADSGHELTWFASNNPDVAKGDKVNIKSTTVKDHTEWQGKKSTVITRTKMDVVEAAERRETDAWETGDPF